MEVNLVKQEPSDVKGLCEDEYLSCDKMAPVGDCRSDHKMARHNSMESRMSEISCTASLKQNGHRMSQNVFSMIGFNAKITLPDKNYQIRYNMGTAAELSQMSGYSPDYNMAYANCCPQTVHQAEQLFSPSGVDLSAGINTFLKSRNIKYPQKKHKGKKSYCCDHCGALFRDHRDLICHTRIHTGEKPYKCSDCGLSVTSLSNLKSHIKIHTDERPYKCDYCDASFRRAHRLKCHMRSHTGEKPYSCDICGASFTLTGSLMVHRKRHSGEKPYKCNDCGASFTRSGSLKHHNRTHSGQKPHKNV